MRTINTHNIQNKEDRELFEQISKILFIPLEIKLPMIISGITETTKNCFAVTKDKFVGMQVRIKVKVNKSNLIGESMFFPIMQSDSSHKIMEFTIYETEEEWMFHRMISQHLETAPSLLPSIN